MGNVYFPADNYFDITIMNIKLVFVAFICIMINTNFISAQETNRKDIAIQLYSVKDRIGSFVKSDYDKDYTSTFKELAQIGYTAIEATGYGNGKFYNRTPEVFKKDAEAAGLKLLSSHCAKPLKNDELASGDFSASLKWWDECIVAHKLAGFSYIVTPWIGKPKTVKDLKTYCDYLNEIGKKCKAAGIKYGYHNHSHEFSKIEDRMMMDFLLENTDPEYVFFEMDVYWVVMSKNSPVDYFNKYPGRFTLLHIRDHREIGQSGMVGFDAILRNAETAGVKHIIVELEQISKTLDEALKISADYLLSAPFVKDSYCR